MDEVPCTVSQTGLILRSSTEQNSGLLREEYASLLDSYGSQAQVAVHEGAIHLSNKPNLQPSGIWYWISLASIKLNGRLLSR
jgi:hypothetical protein